MTQRIGIAGLLLALLCAAALAGCTKPPVSANATANFDFTGFDGKAGSLHGSLGQPLVVNFWAVWCGPCRDEFPGMQEVFTEKAGKFRMISVCVDKQMNPQEFVKAHGLTWEFAYDSEGELSGSKVYKITGIPRTLFIARDGTLVNDHTGSLTKAQFEAELASIL